MLRKQDFPVKFNMDRHLVIRPTDHMRTRWLCLNFYPTAGSFFNIFSWSVMKLQSTAVKVLQQNELQRKR
jgi:hypothetical protein